jgi:hypothetical protein
MKTALGSDLSDPELSRADNKAATSVRMVSIAEVNLQPTEASKAGGALHNQDLTPACSRCLPFIMDKFLLQQQVLERLAKDLLQAEEAARAAHKTATHEENIAKNKYDTLGLEAAYLATGQARRAEAIRQAMAIGATSARASTTPAKVYSSAHWSAWSIPTTSSNSYFSDRMGAA